MWRNMKLFNIIIMALSSAIPRADAQSVQSSTPDGSIPEILQNASQFAKIDRVVGQTQGGEPVELVKLDGFIMEPQGNMHNWCWAATAKSVSAFYNKKSDWSQCKIASKELNRDCCSSNSKQSCDVYGYLQTALCVTDNYDVNLRCDPESDIRGVLNFDAVAREVKAGHPVGVRIVWQSDGLYEGAHFVVIYGFTRDSSGISYLVADPARDTQPPLLENEFRHNYQGYGIWRDSYLTRPAKASTDKVSSLQSPLAIYKSNALEKLNEAQVKKAELKFSAVDNRYTALVAKARPFLDIGNSEIASSEVKQSTLAVPHAIYIAGLRQLATSPDPLPKAPSGTRIFETVDGKLIAAYDFNGADGAAPNLVGGISSKPQIAELASGLQIADRLSEKGSGSAELRLLKVPSLNFEAFWLHYGGSADDVFIPIGATRMPPNQPISTSDLTIALRAFAKQRIESGSLQRNHSAP